VDFESPDDVANAIRKLDGADLKGKRVKLSEDLVLNPLTSIFMGRTPLQILLLHR